MPIVKHDTFFRRNPVFTGDELARHLECIGSGGLRTQERVLGYHSKAGRLRRIRRGMYAVIPPGADSDTYSVDPYLVAAKLTPDAVLSHHTALEFHGRAYSVWQHFIYSAERPVEAFIFRDQLFRGARFPRALVRSGTEYHGVLTAERFGVPTGRQPSADPGGRFAPAGPGRGEGRGVALSESGGVLQP